VVDASKTLEFLKNLTVESLMKALEERLYVADRELATALYLAIQMRKPLLIEGEPGCGKTEVAKVLADILGTELIRLQCYEGLDASDAIYEWDVLHEGPVPPVLLIDEVDRADEEFEGFVLEFLAEYQVTIPEIGTIEAKVEPITILTSNRTREIGDGLKRRCLYYYVTYPSKEKEMKILKLKVKGLSDSLAEQLVSFVNVLRQRPDIMKKPGISETLDWANALMKLGAKELNREVLKSTLVCIVKSQDDLLRIDVDSFQYFTGRQDHNVRP
jgi:MoxR-like ATPase